MTFKSLKWVVEVCRKNWLKLVKGPTISKSISIFYRTKAKRREFRSHFDPLFVLYIFVWLYFWILYGFSFFLIEFNNSKFPRFSFQSFFGYDQDSPKGPRYGLTVGMPGWFQYWNRECSFWYLEITIGLGNVFRILIAIA